MNRVVHFEISAEDTERAAAFYRRVFGWNIDKWSYGDREYIVVMTAERESTEPGINGGMVPRSREFVPASGTNAFICTIQVEDYDATEKAIIEAGGRVAVMKYAVGDLAWQGYFHDTEGNMFGLHQAFSK